MSNIDTDILYASWEESGLVNFTDLGLWGSGYCRLYYCSNCGYKTIFNNEELCPNCNAVMVNS